MLRSLTDPSTLFSIGAALVLLAGAARAILRQRHAHITADSLIAPPRRIYSTFDPALRDATTAKRARVEELRQRARRASAGLPVSGDVVTDTEVMPC
jgi:hypothetical protein